MGTNPQDEEATFLAALEKPTHEQQLDCVTWHRQCYNRSPSRMRMLPAVVSGI